MRASQHISDSYIVKFKDRKQIYDAVDIERNYQDTRWKEPTASVAAMLLYIMTYTDMAKEFTTKGDDAQALDAVRKIAALAVACMEYNGVVERTHG